MADDSYSGIFRALMDAPQGLLSAATPYASGLFGSLGIPQGNTYNSQGQVVYPTNALERGLQGSDDAAQQYAAAFVGPGAKGMRGVTRIPIENIEHGESAMPGGKLTWPGASDLVREYASRPTPLPPIEVMPPDAPGQKFMIYDGSHRLEAAKLRGDINILAKILPDLGK
jgi:hypothetical protein